MLNSNSDESFWSTSFAYHIRHTFAFGAHVNFFAHIFRARAHHIHEHKTTFRRKIVNHSDDFVPVNIQHDHFSRTLHIRCREANTSRCEHHLFLRLKSIGAQKNCSRPKRCCHCIFNIFQIRYVVSRKICKQKIKPKVRRVAEWRTNFESTLTIHRGGWEILLRFV